MRLPPPHRSERGIVLVMTVLVLSILVVLGCAFSYAGGLNLAAARNARDAFQRATAARSALAYAVALLGANAQSAGANADSLNDPWAGDKLSFTSGGIACAVRIEDENRKLNVNRAALPPAADALDLQAALRRLVLSESVGGADSDVEAICGWIDPNRIGSQGDKAPKRPMPLIAGLGAIPDLNQQLVAGAPGKTPLTRFLCTHPDTININTAPKEVLDSLWDNPQVTQAILDQRAQAPLADRQAIESLLANLLLPDDAQRSLKTLSVTSDYFTVRIAPDGGAADGLAALVRRQSTGVQVLSVTRVPKEVIP